MPEKEIGQKEKMPTLDALDDQVDLDHQVDNDDSAENGGPGIASDPADELMLGPDELTLAPEERGLIDDEMEERLLIDEGRDEEDQVIQNIRDGLPVAEVPSRNGELSAIAEAEEENSRVEPLDPVDPQDAARTASKADEEHSRVEVLDHALSENAAKTASPPVEKMEVDPPAPVEPARPLEPAVAQKLARTILDATRQRKYITPDENHNDLRCRPSHQEFRARQEHPNSTDRQDRQTSEEPERREERRKVESTIHVPSPRVRPMYTRTELQSKTLGNRPRRSDIIRFTGEKGTKVRRDELTELQHKLWWLQANDAIKASVYEDPQSWSRTKLKECYRRIRMEVDPPADSTWAATMAEIMRLQETVELLRFIENNRYRLPGEMRMARSNLHRQSDVATLTQTLDNAKRGTERERKQRAQEEADRQAHLDQLREERVARRRDELLRQDWARDRSHSPRRSPSQKRSSTSSDEDRRGENPAKRWPVNPSRTRESGWPSLPASSKPASSNMPSSWERPAPSARPVPPSWGKESTVASSVRKPEPRGWDIPSSSRRSERSSESANEDRPMDAATAKYERRKANKKARKESLREAELDQTAGELPARMCVRNAYGSRIMPLGVQHMRELRKPKYLLDKNAFKWYFNEGPCQREHSAEHSRLANAQLLKTVGLYDYQASPQFNERAQLEETMASMGIQRFAPPELFEGEANRFISKVDDMGLLLDHLFSMTVNPSLENVSSTIAAMGRNMRSRQEGPPVLSIFMVTMNTIYSVFGSDKFMHGLDHQATEFTKNFVKWLQSLSRDRGERGWVLDAAENPLSPPGSFPAWGTKASKEMIYIPA
ncbi:unnamed protein product [Oikopleura dioica]|uniref:Uncharacterized protein n=1 Tax=Oikopleura dioica TaxID=34765 RepID=E4WXY8_OIKDI|nr:unnamed protein product [Oikopleura dioica]